MKTKPVEHCTYTKYYATLTKLRPNDATEPWTSMLWLTDKDESVRSTLGADSNSAEPEANLIFAFTFCIKRIARIRKDGSGCRITAVLAQL